MSGKKATEIVINLSNYMMKILNSKISMISTNLIASIFLNTIFLKENLFKMIDN